MDECRTAAEAGHTAAKVFLSQLIETGLTGGAPSEAEQLLIDAAKDNLEAMYRCVPSESSRFSRFFCVGFFVFLEAK